MSRHSSSDDHQESNVDSPPLGKMSVKFLGGSDDQEEENIEANGHSSSEEKDTQTVVLDGIKVPSIQASRPWSFKIPKNKPKNGAFKHKWAQRFQELKEFKEKFGHVSVTRVTKDFQSLGNWVADQRRKLRSGKLTEEQYNLLTELGMEWDRSYYFKPKIVIDGVANQSDGHKTNK